MRFTMIIFSIFFLTACQFTSQPKTAKTVDMYNKDGDMVGTAKLTEDPDGVKIALKVEGLTPGFHGVHVHEIAKCTAPDFKSAGNHFNPEKKKHGLLNPKGPHIGDLPNIEVDTNGKVDTELTIKDATLLNGKNSLIESGGTSLVITSEADDGMTQISGDSGERIICGEIKEKKGEVDKEKPSDPTDKKEKK
ncbi:superoxide dismutase family protein [Pseudogracilibacillus sp. SE30717A]|uniref:superoxide dismutase family protein n=1 Tax=Pseudogracilibacillus sp. SE30717A TaxID=3098293 RepID=UPI00300DF672